MTSGTPQGANRVRGEAIVQVDGTPRRLRLTLGALAELEDAFGADGVGAVAERLKKGSARDLICALAALLRAAGESEAAEKAASAVIAPGDAARAVAEAFASAHAGDEDAPPGKP